MKRLVGACASVVVFAFLGSEACAGPDSGTSNIVLAAAANSMIQIVDAAVTIAPTSTDYSNNFVQATGASGLRVDVKTNSSTGMVLRVRCTDAVPQIALSDLLIRTQTPPGTGGSTMSSFTPISAADQNLWSTKIAQHPWLTVTTDLRIQNLMDYNDAAGGGTTNYINTLTYTVISL